MAMRVALLAPACAVLLLAGPAAADPILDLLYENAASAQACAEVVLAGGAGLHVDTSAGDPAGIVTVTAPPLAPPGTGLCPFA